jgi:hypothetical protein
LKLRAITMPTGMSTPQPMAASQACACGRGRAAAGLSERLSYMVGGA